MIVGLMSGRLVIEQSYVLAEYKNIMETEDIEFVN